MNCYLHTDLPAVAYCRSCGKALCESCRHLVGGTVYCEEHAPAQEPQPAAPTKPVQPGGGSPALAFVLGLIPGVGAIYNGQYVKGLVHVVVLGTLIGIVDSGVPGNLHPLFGLLIALWFFYMAFEAYHTADKRLRGLPVDEFSSLIPLRSSRAASKSGPVALILLGAFFLLMTTRPEWLRLVFRWWPVALIVAGVYMLVVRLKTRPAEDAASGEVSHERM